MEEIAFNYLNAKIDLSFYICIFNLLTLSYKRLAVCRFNTFLDISNDSVWREETWS